MRGTDLEEDKVLGQKRPELRIRPDIAVQSVAGELFVVLHTGDPSSTQFNPVQSSSTHLCIHQQGPAKLLGLGTCLEIIWECETLRMFEIFLVITSSRDPWKDNPERTGNIEVSNSLLGTMTLLIAQRSAPIYVRFEDMRCID